MLKTLDGKVMSQVPHETDFKDALMRLQPQRAEEVRAALNSIK